LNVLLLCRFNNAMLTLSKKFNPCRRRFTNPTSPGSSRNTFTKIEGTTIPPE